MNRPILHGLTAVSLALGACASAPVHYHTLLPVLENRTTAGQPPSGFAIDVLAVGIPAQLDQPQLVVRQGPTGVAVLDGERWAGPLGEEVRNALSAELVHRLQTRDVAGLAKPANKPVLRLKVQIRRLDAWPGSKVSLDADWALGFAGEAADARLVCSGQFEAAAAGGYPELVLGQQRLVAALAERIAADARNWERSRAAACSGNGAATKDAGPAAG
ncbi:membrane integrity-associated transporter subunit PqiC [Propionivibrio sp.]|uniref:PqiC family protein n=1 Tax=Propionivibrio sp. TaxID=2212460 RepID=UPI0039E2A85C